jgi:excinuclease UvrABC nuclease subunit
MFEELNWQSAQAVYLMCAANDAILYVGKAKNLRKRLASYRVANPDRMSRQHLLLLRAVARIEFQASVNADLELLPDTFRSLKPAGLRAE